MMFFQDHHFPRCGRFIRQHFPVLEKTSPKVFKALIEACEDEATVRRGLSTSQYPRVHVEALYASRGWNYKIPGIYMGACFEAERNRININDDSARVFEELGNTAAFEPLIMHEFVHWARHVSGKPDTIKNNEAGDFFEHKAYGDELNDHSGIECPDTERKPTPLGKLFY